MGHKTKHKGHHDHHLKIIIFWSFLWQSEAQSTLDPHAQHKQMGPVDVNDRVCTARKQDQSVCIGICARASCVDWAWAKQFSLSGSGLVCPKIVVIQGRAPCVWRSTVKPSEFRSTDSSVGFRPCATLTLRCPENIWNRRQTFFRLLQAVAAFFSTFPKSVNI